MRDFDHPNMCWERNSARDGPSRNSLFIAICWEYKKPCELFLICWDERG